MMVPPHLVNVATIDEIIKLIHFYGTDLHSAYVKKLNKKYSKLYVIMIEYFPPPDDDPPPTPAA